VAKPVPALLKVITADWSAIIGDGEVVTCAIDKQENNNINNVKKIFFFIAIDIKWTENYSQSIDNFKIFDFLIYRYHFCNRVDFKNSHRSWTSVSKITISIISVF
jgi:hypothetical protein